MKSKSLNVLEHVATKYDASFGLNTSNIFVSQYDGIANRLSY